MPEKGESVEATHDEGTVRHKTLSAYYPVLKTLGTLLSFCDTLEYNSDPDEYRDLLRTTLCAPHQPATPFPPLGCAERTQQEAIDAALQSLVTARGKRGDVLVFGTKASSQHFNAARPGVETHVAACPSTLGDAAFNHLLVSTSLFLELGNNCYLQLSGPPVHALYDHAKHGNAPPKDQTCVKRVREVDVPGPRARKRQRRKEGSGTVQGVGPTHKQSPSAASVNLNRQRILYSRPQCSTEGKIRYGLPKGHILRNVAAKGDDEFVSDSACEALLPAIFPAPSKAQRAAAGDEESVRGSPARHVTMIGAMRELVARHARINYGAILSRCLERTADVELESYPSLAPRAGSAATGINSGLSGFPAQPPEAISQRQVCRFLTAVVRALLSTYIAGSEDNLQVICRNVRRLVSAKIYEPISLHSLLQGLRVNDFAWLLAGEGRRVPPSEARKRRLLVEQFIFWLFEEYLIPLLRSTFYATETATTRYETVYFPHSSWVHATGPHLRSLEAVLLEELNEDGKAAALKHPLGVSSVRLIPKPNGFRPIVNLGKRIKVPNALGISAAPGKLASANEIFSGVHQILTFEKNRLRSSLGSCLFGTNEIFAPVQSLKRELKGTHGQLPKLYFAKMDIKAAFDTIKQDKMLEVVDQLLSQNHDYCLMLYCLLLPPASKASQASARRLFKSRAGIIDNANGAFGEHAKTIAAPLRNAVVVDLMRPQEVSRAACMDLLRSHIQNNVWQVGSKVFRQKTGIPQGSKISSLLCSFFYSWLEADYLSWTRRRGTRLLRYIDDFLLVTDDYDIARRFVETMSRGFPEYGAFVSSSKTLLSFEMSHNGQAVPVAAVRNDGASSFPYCGFLIDTSTLAFTIDTARLTDGPIQQSFALRKNRHVGASFVGWLSRQLENRNHVAYLDTQHNDAETVYLNVFVNFALTAMKVPHYFGASEMGAKRAVLLHGWLCMAVEYTYNAGRARVRHAARGDTTEHYAVRRRHFGYVAISAFRLVFARKVAKFHRVVRLLERDLAEHRYRAGATEMEPIVRRGWELVQNARF